MRFDVPALDKLLGMELYLTNAPAVGGRLRSYTEDFSVVEIPQGVGSIEEFTSKLSRTASRYENFAFFLLRKQGIDTIQAVTKIADHLQLKESEIAYAGLKDAKAVTRQLISLPWRSSYQRILTLPNGLELELLGFNYRPLSLGELYGNEFSIVARGIRLEHDSIIKRLEAVTKQLRESGGFPAYFGYQRFGSRRPISHLVGEKLYQNDPESALKIFLTHSFTAEPVETQAARTRLCSEWNYREAKGYFPRYLTLELDILQHLSRKPKDFQGALRSLPRRLERVFYDAYQSYLFNRALSLRLRKRKPPSEILKGDILASFDERGYVTRLVKADGRNLRRLEDQVAQRKLAPIISIPSKLNGARQSMSPEVSEILEDENAPQTEKKDGRNHSAESGLIRPVFAEAENLGWIIGEDEYTIGSRKVVFYFRLRRSHYATVLLREFLKPVDPQDAGY